ncbi:MAG: cytochrome P450 [Ilumatobacteraceae bacterium]
MTTIARPVVDLLDPQLYRTNPHEVWTWMRANEPIYRDERNGLWAITRHADIQDVERRSSVFVSSLGYRANWAAEEINMIAQDDPRHRQQRMLVQPQLTHKAVDARQPDLERLARELIDALIGSTDAQGIEGVEMVEALAGQMPARTTCRLLGFPEDLWPQVKQWSERLMRTDMIHRDGQQFAEFIDANMQFATMIGMLAPEKLEAAAAGCPMNDFLTTWLTAEIDGAKLSPEAVVHETGLFIAGGAETTRTAISHGLRAFVDHPDQWEAMAADPSLVPGAVEEVLRWVTPLNNFFRRAVADTEVAGQAIARGDRVIMIYPSANRDETVFEDPFSFDIRRSPNPHLAFGFGTHLCVGNNFARASLATVFGQLSQRLTDLRVVEEPDVEPNIFARAVRSFRLGFRVRP